MKRREHQLTTYDAAIEATCRKFKNKRACDETFDEMCAWAEKWLKRRGYQAVVTWKGVVLEDGGKTVSFQVTDLSKIHNAEFAGKLEA